MNTDKCTDKISLEFDFTIEVSSSATIYCSSTSITVDYLYLYPTTMIVKLKKLLTLHLTPSMSTTHS